MTRDIITISGGEGSWRAAKLRRLHNPAAAYLLVFTDTIYEDADTYRFLLESVADITGRKVDWIPSAEEFPDYRVAEGVPLAEYRGNLEWRAFLADLRAKAAIAFPEFVWLVEGRDPWEIYRDELFIGNSRADPCSKVAKRRMLERWREEHGDRGTDVLVWGIGEHEAHRYEREEFDKKAGKVVRKGIKPRLEAQGWRAAAPLIELPPHPIKDLSCRLYGLEPQRLYAAGYSHGNCGGFCCKGGHAHWQNRYRVDRERFDYDAMMERKCRAHIGQGTILTETVGGTKRPLSLDEFAKRLERSPEITFEPRPGEGGCGCMLDEAA